MSIAIMGGGSWGTALALLLGRKGHTVTLYHRDPDHFEGRENVRYLPGHPLPENVRVSALRREGEPVRTAVLAVPAAECLNAATFLPPHDRLVIAAKGIEPTEGRLLADLPWPGTAPGAVGVLSGPNLAVEVARGVPTVALSAFPDREVAEDVARLFTTPTFRVSPTDDVVGVELAGALKNVLAIGAGISDGLGFGDNTKGAFLSRGLLDMARLGATMGACPETFLGPAGAGDLFATAVSKLSRNYRFGELLGRGANVSEALGAINQVVEGVPTATALRRLCPSGLAAYPVLACVVAVIEGHMTPRLAVEKLMSR